MTSSKHKYAFSGTIVLFLASMVLSGYAFGQAPGGLGGFGGGMAAGNSSQDMIMQNLERGKAALKSKNYDEAEYSLKKAADQGNAEAQFLLGDYYAQKNGITNRSRRSDTKKALEWYRKAADQGHVEARERIGEHYRELDAMVELAKRQAKADGAKYFNEGVEEYHNGNYRKALDAFKKAADLGVHEAELNVGIIYDEKLQNKSEAVKWYRRAADHGDTNAMFNLGICYGKGEGVRKDYDEAEKWLRKAAELGNEDAKDLLKRLEED